MTPASYMCLRCFALFTANPNPPPLSCPACGHLYFRWTNYDAWTTRRSKSP